MVSLDAQVLEFREFSKNISCRSDGIRAEEELESRLFGGGHQTPSSGGVARDVAVFALFKVGSFHAIGVGEELPSVGIVITSVEDGAVGLDHLVLALELGLEVGIDSVEFAVEEVHHDAEGKHVLRLEHGFVVHAEVFQGFLGEFRNRGLHDLVVGEGAINRRVVGIAGLFKSLVGHRVGVEDDDGSRTEPTHVRLDGGRVHGNQHVAEVARGVDRFVSEVHLET